MRARSGSADHVAHRTAADRASPTGSWKTTCIVALAALAATRRGGRARRRPSTSTEPAVGVDQAQQAARERRLARARLADERHRPRPADVEVDACHGADGHLALRRRGTRLIEAADPDERRCDGRSPRSRLPSGLHGQTRPARGPPSATVTRPPPAPARWHAARCPAPTVAQQRPLDAAAIDRDRTAIGERAAHQRCRTSAGTVPGIERSAARARSPAAARPPAGRACTGAAGVANSASAVAAVSTTRPAYSTTTRSHTARTTPRSWVMNSTLKPALLLEPADELAGSGPRWSRRARSSARRRSAAAGGTAAPCAIIARWSMPPDSWCGYARMTRSDVGQPDVREHLADARFGLAAFGRPHRARRARSRIWRADA